MKPTSSVPAGGARPARFVRGRRSAQARLRPSGKTTPKPSRLATAGHEVHFVMSAPVCVLPWSTITSGAGFVSASWTMKLRVTPLMSMVSAKAGPPNKIASTAASLNARISGIARSGLSRHRLRRGAPGVAAREQAAAEKGAFQRAIAVHAAATAGRLARGVEPRHDLAVLAEHAGVQIGLEAAQRLAGQDIEFYGDQRP